LVENYLIHLVDIDIEKEFVMNKTLFISYSHVDKKYRDSFEVHLSSMERQGLLKSWSDRELIAGSEWDGEISEKLETANIIVFLVSPDFIKSQYCYDKEVKLAMDRHNSQSAVVIPIFIRNCDWQGAPFGKLQALPEDARPVKLWEDEDSAWVNVVGGVRRAVEAMSETVYQELVAAEEWSGSYKLSQNQQKWLDDTEVQLNNRNTFYVSLKDIYVPPHLKILEADIDEVIKPVDAENISGWDGNILVFGDEQTGKTSLAKYLFNDYYSMGYLPVYVDSHDVSSASIEDFIGRRLNEQYDDLKPEPLSGKVLILDNFSEIRLNKKYTNKFINECNKYFDKVVIFAIDSYQYVVSEIDEVDDYKHLEILPLGNLKRSEIVKKWVSLGVIEQIEEETLYLKIDELTLRLNSLVRKNIVPPKPIFILALLQMFEAYTPQNLELTSYGHCYQYLVYQALDKSGVKPHEIEKYLNIITEFSWVFYKKNKGIDGRGMADFFSNYREDYVLCDDEKSIVNKLTGNSILVLKDGIYTFKYPYIYYFFVAKKIAESFSSSEDFKDEIRVLLRSLHREDCANIIVFITHHTKEKWILDEIQLCLMSLFEDQEEASLSKDSLSFMEDFLAEIPDLVLEHKEIDSARRDRDKAIDEIDWEREADEGRGKESISVEELEPSDLLAKVNMVFKGIEIVGQIIRNRHASIHRDLLRQMVEFSTSTGLRFLHYFIQISDVSKDEVVKMLEHVLRENPTIRDQDLEKEAKNMFLHLTYGVIYSVLRKISASVGSKEADEIYDEIECSMGTPAVKLINQAIGLQFKKKLDFRKLDELVRDFHSNPTCTRILKEIVIQHVYMFPVEYKDKQKIQETLGISMQGQRLMGLKKQLKL
jgi:TIR domain-containing protein